MSAATPLDAAAPTSAGQRRPVARWLRRAGLYLAAAALLLSAFQLGQVALASRYSDQAEAILLHFAALAKRSPTPAELAYLRRLLQRALALDPANPAHHDRLGQLDLWELATQAVTPDRRQALHEEGLAQARLSLALQPGWALSWARLLVWKSEFEELDGEFRMALARATTLGQWQIKIHSAVLRATLPVRERLDPQDLELALATGVRGLRQDPVTIRALLAEYGELGSVCQRLPPDDPVRTRHCPTP